MNWLLLTLLSAITASLSRILQKVLLRDDQSDPFAFGFVFQLSVAGIFLIYTLITGSFEFPSYNGLLINVLIMAIFYSLGNVCIFKAFKYAAASEVSIILATSTIWIVIASFFILGERINGLNFVGILLILVSVIAINYSKNSWKFSKGHVFALLGSLLFGIAFTNDAYIVTRYHSIASYMVIAFAVPGVCSLLFSPKSIYNLGYFAHSKVVRNLIICSLFYSLSAITIFTAYKLGGQASIISSIQQTNIIFTVIFGYLVLKEKDKLANKIVGALLAFLGVMLLI